LQTRDDLDKAFERTALVRKLANVPLEGDLIGMCLTNPKAYQHTIGRLYAEDFYEPVHAWLFREISKRMEAAQLINHNTIREFCTRLDKQFPNAFSPENLSDWGSITARTMAEYVSRLIADAPGAGLAASHAEQLHELAIRRRVVDVAIQTISEAVDSDQADLVVGDSLERFECILGAGKGVSRDTVIAGIIDRTQNPAAIYETGYAALDLAMGGGMEVGRVYGVAGLGKMGKSLLAGGVSQNLERNGVPHTYIALEMGAAEIEGRAIAAELGLNSMQLRGFVHASTQNRLIEYRQQIGNAIRYVDMPGGDFSRLRSEVMAAKWRHGSTGIILDYWQLIGGRDRGVSEEEHLRRVAEWLAAAAKRLKIWILIMAQLADDGEATAISRTGLNRNVDQLYFIRGDRENPTRWLQMRASRYTPTDDVGSEGNHPFIICAPGPAWKER
jgi:replicative DNA helicase